MKLISAAAALSTMFLCVAWTQPLFLPPWVAFHGEMFAFAALIVALSTLLVFNGKKWNIEIAFPEVSLSLLLALIVIQFLRGDIPFLGDLVIYALYLGGLIFAITVGRANGCQITIIKYVALCVGFSSVGSAFLALIQNLSLEDQYVFTVNTFEWRRPGANLAQPNNLGTLLIWGQASIIYLYAIKEIEKLIAYMLLIILMVGVAITESRIALLGVFVMSFWIFAMPQAGGVRAKFQLYIFYILLALGLFILWPKLIWAYQEGAWAFDEVDIRIINTQSGARKTVSIQLLLAACSHPFLGWGFGGVSRALNAIIDQYEISYPFTYAHNILIDLIIGIGFPAACVLGVGWLIWIVRRLTFSPTGELWLAIAILIPFALHSMTEFPFAYAYFLFPVGVALGAIDAGRAAKFKIKVSLPLFSIVFLLWCLLAFLACRDYFLIEEDFRIARMEARKIGATPREYVRPKIILLDQLDGINMVTRITPTPAMAIEDMIILRKLALNYPWTAMQSRYALALALNGDVIEAKRQLNVIRVMHGSKVYTQIIDGWKSLAEGVYPQLRDVISFHYVF